MGGGGGGGKSELFLPILDGTLSPSAAVGLIHRVQVYDILGFRLLRSMRVGVERG